MSFDYEKWARRLWFEWKWYILLSECWNEHMQRWHATTPQRYTVYACSKGKGQRKHEPHFMTQVSCDLQWCHLCYELFASSHKSCVMYGKAVAEFMLSDILYVQDGKLLKENPAKIKQTNKSLEAGMETKKAHMLKSKEMKKYTVQLNILIQNKWSCIPGCL